MRRQVAQSLGLALALGVAAVADCGFDREPPYSGRRNGDVAPWRDLGPVTFCDGALRIGVPASKPAGFCASAAAAKACTRDDECQSRERCTCGGCQVALCSSGDECGAGSVCTFADQRCDRSCASDGDCGPGEVCPPGDGVCRGTCAASADCQRGEQCEAGRCVAQPCASDVSCDVACAVQRIPGELREPSPLAAEGGVVMWLERAVGPERAVWRATSSDGRIFRFDPPRAVIAPGPGDLARAGAPTVLARQGGYLAVFADGAGRLRRATSDDGIGFTVDATPLAAPALAWEQSGLEAPALAASPTGEGVLLYHGTVDRTAVGLLDSDDGVTFRRRAAPLLTPAAVEIPDLWRGVDRVASPFAEPFTAADGQRGVRLYFAARGRESGASVQFGQVMPAIANFSVGVAATLDGSTLVVWPFDPIFDRVLSFLTHLGELDPAVVTLGDGRRLLYYRGAATDESKPSNLGVAENPVLPE